jgi:hypothetical protein
MFFAVLPLLAAESTASLEQFLRAIANELEAEPGDADLARRIEWTKLTERLSEDEIRWLSAAGTGPGTVKALQKLQER